MLLRRVAQKVSIRNFRRLRVDAAKLEEWVVTAATGWGW
jgi:hypothetical protein